MTRDEKIQKACEAATMAFANKVYSTIPPKGKENFLKIATAIVDAISDPEPQNIPRVEPIKREDLVSALSRSGLIRNNGLGQFVNGQQHSRTLEHCIDESLRWLNELQIDEPQGCMIFKVPLPEIEKLREALNASAIPADHQGFEAHETSVYSNSTSDLLVTDGTLFCSAGFGGPASARALAIAAVLNFVRKLI